jgi:hypothetical protein
MWPNAFMYCQNKCITLTVGKGSTQMLATSLIFNNLNKENNLPMGGNSDNLVTLA